MTHPETQVAALFARFTPELAKLGKALRAKLRRRLPGLLELVYFYEGQGSLVISYSPTEAGADGVCAMSVRPDGVRLVLLKAAGGALAAPGTRLQGKGKKVNHVVLGSEAELESAEVEAWLDASARLAPPPVDGGAKGSTILKVEAQKARARKARATKAPRVAKRAAPKRAAPKRKA